MWPPATGSARRERIALSFKQWHVQVQAQQASISAPRPTAAPHSYSKEELEELAASD